MSGIQLFTVQYSSYKKGRVQKKDGKDIVKRFGWFVTSNDSHGRVNRHKKYSSQEVKANLGIERTNEKNCDEYISYTIK